MKRGAWELVSVGGQHQQPNHNGLAYVVDIEGLAINGCSDLESLPLSRPGQSITRTKFGLPTTPWQWLRQLRQQVWALRAHTGAYLTICMSWKKAEW